VATGVIDCRGEIYILSLHCVFQYLPDSYFLMKNTVSRGFFVILYLLSFVIFYWLLFVEVFCLLNNIYCIIHDIFLVLLKEKDGVSFSVNKNGTIICGDVVDI
jgi:hypothetical protein